MADDEILCMRCQHPNTLHPEDDVTYCQLTSCMCDGWQEPMLSFPIVHATDDMICMGCSRPLPRGVPYRTHFSTVGDDGMTWFDVTCVYCPAPADDTTAVAS